MDTNRKPISPEAELARRVIANLGGSCAVARLCEIRSQSVSGWRHNGLPHAQEKFLRLAHPEAFVKQKRARR